MIYYTGETIRKNGGKYCLYSKSGRSLGCYDTMAGAKRREKQVQFFKHQKADITDDEIISLLKDKKDLRYL